MNLFYQYYNASKSSIKPQKGSLPFDAKIFSHHINLIVATVLYPCVKYYTESIREYGGLAHACSINNAQGAHASMILHKKLTKSSLKHALLLFCDGPFSCGDAACFCLLLPLPLLSEQGCCHCSKSELSAYTKSKKARKACHKGYTVSNLQAHVVGPYAFCMHDIKSLFRISREAIEVLSGGQMYQISSKNSMTLRALHLPS
jgi:hypothetical protein